MKYLSLLLILLVQNDILISQLRLTENHTVKCQGDIINHGSYTPDGVGTNGYWTNQQNKNIPSIISYPYDAGKDFIVI